MDGQGQTEDYPGLWRRIEQEIHKLILYAEETLKGALVEVGMALAFGIPVIPDGVEGLGSWSHHPLVRAVEEAIKL